MIRKEIENKLDTLETRLFYINMVDRWTEEDKKLYDKVTKEIRELKKELNEIDGVKPENKAKKMTKKEIEEAIKDTKITIACHKMVIRKTEEDKKHEAKAIAKLKELEEMLKE